ncbi:MAG: protoheme IX farnesyltransferase [Calditrichia bacterium]
MLELGKFRIAQLVTLSTATGYILASGRFSLHMLIPMAGILLLALGSGALNQYQERARDAKMPRTCNRPIPSRRISPRGALVISFGLMLAGAVVLYSGTNPTALILGLLTAVWYNGVYTNLKKITPLAVIPGSLIGSLPPMVGWVSAGGYVFSPVVLALAFFFFIWQIPHFWLLLLNFGQDYEKAGYPSLTAMMDRGQLGRLTFMWIVATAAAIIILPVFGLAQSVVIFFLLFISAAALVYFSLSLIRSSGQGSFRLAFRSINFFILLVMVLITIDRLI